MIKSYRSRSLKRFYEKSDKSQIDPSFHRRVSIILDTLDTAATIEDLNLPLLRFHKLTGNLNGFWSLTVRANWRIIFRFEDGDAYDVELVDYH